MTHDPLKIGVALALSAVLGLACYSDWHSRRLPNWCSLAALVLFVPWAFSGTIDGVLLAVAAFGVAAVVAFALYLAKIVGAGDTKLFSVLALFAGVRLLPEYALAVVLCGAVVGVVSIITRPTQSLISFQSRGTISFGRGVPYGLAISAGALLVVWAQAVNPSLLPRLL